MIDIYNEYTFTDKFKLLYEEKKAEFEKTTHEEFSQRRLERELKINSATISDFLNARENENPQNPKLKTIRTIANYFNVSVEYLVTDTDVRTNDMDLKAVCEYTGLNENTVQAIRDSNTSRYSIKGLLDRYIMLYFNQLENHLYDVLENLEILANKYRREYEHRQLSCKAIDDSNKYSDVFNKIASIDYDAENMDNIYDGEAVLNGAIYMAQESITELIKNEFWYKAYSISKQAYKEYNGLFDIKLKEKFTDDYLAEEDRRDKEFDVTIKKLETETLEYVEEHKDEVREFNDKYKKEWLDFIEEHINDATTT